MQYVELGKTRLKVSRVSFGGIPIQRVDQKGADELIDALIEQGINYIDTARGYTVSEELIGNALIGKRDKFYLATVRVWKGISASASKICVPIT